MARRESPRCERPNKSGTTCQGTRVAVAYGALDVAPACNRHLTDQERAEIAHVEARWQQELQAAYPEIMRLVPLDTQDPACWTWEVQGDLWDFHRGRCATCGAQRVQLVEDHDHDTGLIRGYLCRSCNGREGTATRYDDHIWSRYRRRNPASILGIVERYIDPLSGVEDAGNTARWADYNPVDRSPVHKLNGRFG